MFADYNKIFIIVGVLLLTIFALMSVFRTTENFGNFYKREYAENVDDVINISPEIVSNNNSTVPPSQNLLPVYNEATNFVETTKPTDVLKSHNFIYTNRQVNIPSISQASKIQYYDLRPAPVVVKDESLFFNISPNDTPIGAGRLNLNI